METLRAPVRPTEIFWRQAISVARASWRGWRVEFKLACLLHDSLAYQVGGVLRGRAAAHKGRPSGEVIPR